MKQTPDPVELMTVPTEMEAAEVCGYLAQFGIEARYDKNKWTLPFNWAGRGAAGVGPQAIWVHAKDADRARELLASLPS